VGAQARHPLDPLTFQEQWTVLEVLREAGRYSNRTGVAQVTLREPAKSLVWGWTAGQAIPRAALAVIVEDGRTYEAVVDVAGRRLLSHTHIPGAQASWLNYEYDVMHDDVVAHPDFVAAMARRGITDLTFIDCGGIPPGYFGTPEERGRRIALVRCHDARDGRDTWPRAIEGLSVVYDVNDREVLRVIDEGVVPPPPAATDTARPEPLREALPPITITQPQGPGFRIDGHMVEWQDWSFHVRPDHRTGMIISTVRHRDGDRVRPVLYQGHLSEIFVPYMDPATAWYTRNFLDLGEYVAGGLASPLEPGLDCPDGAAFMDGIVVADNGRPVDVPKVVCIFERMTGDVAWRRLYDGRAARELVVRMITVLGNYDYIFDWTFQQDGAIRITVGATGTPAIKTTRERDAQSDPGSRADAYGRFVAAQTVAVNHDHYFNFRLDVDVDGPVNRFHADRLETERLPEDHPRRSLWVRRDQVLAREQDARLSMDMHRPALWRVASTTAKNRVGYATSYQLVPGHNVMTLLSEDDYPRRRAGFIDHNLWVTPFDAAERFAAGDYPTLSEPGAGLPAWTARNRSIDATDIVLWYTVGMHHVVRSEDWPVMPVSWHSFELRPFDFFDTNPAARLPR
jgi:primary-amine oxidase